jgi:hypothetical protein
MKIFYILMLMLAGGVGCMAQPAADTGTGNVQTGLGVLAGTIVRGPVCPVMTRDKPCPPRPAAGAMLVVATMKGERIVTVTAGPDGRFHADLQPGAYRISLAGQGMEFSKNLPATVEINAGHETRLEVFIDTGIR